MEVKAKLIENMGLEVDTCGWFRHLIAKTGLVSHETKTISFKELYERAYEKSFDLPPLFVIKGEEARDPDPTSLDRKEDS